MQIIKKERILRNNTMKSTLIKDTTKSERIELIKSWVPEEGSMDESDIDLWEMYRDYIDGKREIREINESLTIHYCMEG